MCCYWGITVTQIRYDLVSISILEKSGMIDFIPATTMTAGLLQKYLKHVKFIISSITQSTSLNEACHTAQTLHDNTAMSVAKIVTVQWTSAFSGNCEVGQFSQTAPLNEITCPTDALLVSTFNVFISCTQEYVLGPNWQKTKVQALGCREDMPLTIKVQGQDVKVVEKFVYLGSQ